MAFFFADKDVRELLPMKDAIDAVEDGYRQMARGEGGMVPRFSATAPPTPGFFYLRWFMPAWLYGFGVIGAKLLLTTTPGTASGMRGRFLVLLFDARSGALLAQMEGDDLTKIRTAAVTGVATKYLSRRESSTLGVFGSSHYARDQVTAVCAVRPIKRIVVYSPTPEHRRRFADEMRQLLGKEVVAVDQSEDAAVRSDVIVTVTNSREPVLRGEWLREGTHVTAMGSSRPDHREVDDQTVRRSKFVVEFLEQALREAGDVVMPIKSGVITAGDLYGELADIVGGKRPGRVSDKEITLFQFGGAAIDDVACAFMVYQRGRERGRGVEVSFAG